MLETLRKHGLVAFMLALAAVCAYKAVAEWGTGRYLGSAGVALLMIAIVAEELERREMVRHSFVLRMVRWGGVLGALGFLLWE